MERSDLARACRAWGGMLWLPPAIDGPRLLWAIAGCESSFGANCAQREEPYYQKLAESGANEQLTDLFKKFGSAAWSSFGPWQELLVNCSPAMTPHDFVNVNRAAMEVVSFINRRILAEQRPSTLEEIAVAYNAGKWRWLTTPPGAERYADECRKYYDTEPLPAAAV